MAKPILSETQRRDIARRLAAGEKHPDIAAAVGCSIANVAYHSRKQKPAIAVVKETLKTAAITLGLSEVDARVAQLEWLNAKLQADLADGMYGVDIKMSATGKTVEVPAFKGQQVAQLRGTLDDIAKERGGRKTKMEVTGKDGASISYTLHFDRADDARQLQPPESLPEAT
jgi:hypothetical protein